MTPADKSLFLNTTLQLIKAGSGTFMGCPIERILNGLALANYRPAAEQLDEALLELRTLGYVRFEEDPMNAAVRYYFPTAEGLKHLQRIGLG